MLMHMQVPVLFFLLAAATYPILRDASEARKDSDGVDGDNPFRVFAGGLLSVKNKLLQPLRGGDHDPHALRAAQQDAYAVKVAEHQAGGEGGKGGLAGILSGSGRKLPDSWGSHVTKSADDHEENKQVCAYMSVHQHLRKPLSQYSVSGVLAETTREFRNRGPMCSDPMCASS